MCRNRCFYCKEPGHRLDDCRKRQDRNNGQNSACSSHTRNSFRTHQSSFRRIVEQDHGYEDKDEEEDTG